MGSRAIYYFQGREQAKTRQRHTPAVLGGKGNLLLSRSRASENQTLGLKGQTFFLPIVLEYSFRMNVRSHPVSRITSWTCAVCFSNTGTYFWPVKRSWVHCKNGGRVCSRGKLVQHPYRGKRCTDFRIFEYMKKKRHRFSNIRMEHSTFPCMTAACI